jgi:hypothetical protein
MQAPCTWQLMIFEINLPLRFIYGCKNSYLKRFRL